MTAIISDETNKGVTIVNEDFLIGTYTSKTSKGMYAVTLNHDHQQLENVRLVAASQKPAYLQQVGDRVSPSSKTVTWGAWPLTN